MRQLQDAMAMMLQVTSKTYPGCKGGCLVQGLLGLVTILTSRPEDAGNLSNMQVCT